MVRRVYCTADTAPQKSERVLSSSILGNRYISLHWVAVLAVFWKNAMGLALFGVPASYDFALSYNRRAQILPHLFLFSNYSGLKK
jgi:hypothetical protein